MPTENILKIRLRPRTKNQLRQLAELEGTSMSAIAKLAIESMIRDRNPVTLTTAKLAAN